MIRIIICGANGSMGQVLAKTISRIEDMEVVAGVDTNADALENPFPVYAAIGDIREKADILIDFSRPQALENNLCYARDNHLGMVIATTGYSQAEKGQIASFAQTMPIFFSANMSLGVNLQLELCRQSADFFAGSAEVEIIEKHHNLKVDAPSGTALALADTINEALGGKMKYQNGRHGNNSKRTAEEIGIHAIRGGTYVGEHEVLFITNDEVLTVSHRAQSKQVFAIGAARAARYLYQKPAGLYNMKDIIAETRAVTRLTLNTDEAMIMLSNIPKDINTIAKIFKAIADVSINIDIITQSVPKKGLVQLDFSLPQSALSLAVETLQKLNLPIAIDTMSNLTKIVVEGIGMEHRHGVAATLFSILAEVNVEIIIISTSETKISFCVEKSASEKAAIAVSKAFSL